MLHNDEGFNPRRKNNYKYVCTQHSTSICKANANIRKVEVDSNTIIVGDFNTPLSSMDRSSRQKINKEIQALNNTLDQKDLTNIFRTFHPKTAEYIFPPKGTFWNILQDRSHIASQIKPQ